MRAPTQYPHHGILGSVTRADISPALTFGIRQASLFHAPDAFNHLDFHWTIFSFLEVMTLPGIGSMCLWPSVNTRILNSAPVGVCTPTLRITWLMHILVQGFHGTGASRVLVLVIPKWHQASSSPHGHGALIPISPAPHTERINWFPRLGRARH